MKKGPITINLLYDLYHWKVFIGNLGGNSGKDSLLLLTSFERKAFERNWQIKTEEKKDSSQIIPFFESMQLVESHFYSHFGVPLQITGHNTLGYSEQAVYLQFCIPHT